jgi:hypothetical protein
VNHLVTGYDTTFTRGEMAIAGFEVGAGCGRLWMVWYINLTMLALGLIACPRGVFAAFVRGRRSKSVYRCGESPARLAAMSLTDVRRLLRLDRESPAPSALDRVGFLGWAVLAISVLTAPAFIVLAMLGTFA